MGLLEQIADNRALRFWEGRIPVQNLYTVGLAGERFFRALKDEEKILGTRCQSCQLTYVPPAIYCERCFAELNDWVEVPPEGEVHAFTVLQVDPGGHRLPRPRVLALVHLKDAHGGLIHWLDGVEPSRVKIGMKVRVVFRPPAERTGSINDLVGFQPVRS